VEDGARPGTWPSGVRNCQPAPGVTTERWPGGPSGHGLLGAPRLGGWQGPQERGGRRSGVGRHGGERRCGGGLAGGSADGLADGVTVRWLTSQRTGLRNRLLICGFIDLKSIWAIEC
jgi:hypothetical protein